MIIENLMACLLFSSAQEDPLIRETVVGIKWEDETGKQYGVKGESRLPLYEESIEAALTNAIMAFVLELHHDEETRQEQG